MFWHILWVMEQKWRWNHHFFLLFNFFFGSPFCSEILQLGYEICLRRNVEICFASMPSLPLPPSLSLFPPSYFASSNWPVITNLKNIADVRYDHASNVPQWAGLWSKKKNRVRPCVIPKKRRQKNEIVSPCVKGRRAKLSPRVCVSERVCVSLSHVTVQDCIQAEQT